MSLADDTQALLVGLAGAGVEFIVVGMSAAVAQGVPAVTFDLDIVHRRSDDNVDRLLVWLLAHEAFHRFDLANRRLPPTREVLLGTGHVNLQTNHGKLDVLCELAPGEGYDELAEDTVLVETGSVVVRVLGLHIAGRIIVAVHLPDGGANQAPIGRRNGGCYGARSRTVAGTSIAPPPRRIGRVTTFASSNGTRRLRSPV